MGFSNEIKDEILVKSARHCCVCHKAKGLNIEVHHINPRKQGGSDTLENAIALCFDCHADAGHYFAGHPKGSKLSPNELLKHKEEWFKIVRENKITEPKNVSVELSLNNKSFNEVFEPIFVKETTTYSDRNLFKKMYEALGKDASEFVETFKKDSLKGYSKYLDYKLDQVKSYDELIDYLNMDFIKDEEQNINCQPVLHKLGAFRNYKEINKSNCTLNLKLTNYGPEVLEDYKLYLHFENVIEADSVNKNNSFSDFYEYKYNVHFFEAAKGEFNPARNVLVQNDSVILDAICFRPNHEAKSVTLNWELFARGIYCSGNLKIEMKPKFEKKTRHKYVEETDVSKNSIRILPKLTSE